jgi:hypothetical protein
MLEDSERSPREFPAATGQPRLASLDLGSRDLGTGPVSLALSIVIPCFVTHLGISHTIALRNLALPSARSLSAPG